MRKDFGNVSFILGTINILVSAEVTVFINIIEEDGRWSFPFIIIIVFNLFGFILFLLSFIFGILGIRRSSFIGMGYIGIILGFFGWIIIGIFSVEPVLLPA